MVVLVVVIVLGNMMMCFGMVMFVMMMIMFMFDFFHMDWLMNFFFNNFFLLDNCWLMVMMNGFDLGVGVLMMRTFDWNMNDDFFLFGVTDKCY